MYANTLYNFGVSEEIGLHILENTAPDDYIYVYNLNPEIYFFSQRRCPTNSLTVDIFTTASLTPEERIKWERIVREKIKSASPRYIVTSKVMPISFFEGITGNRYFLEREYHAGFDVMKNPVCLQLFKIRKSQEAQKYISEGEELFGQNKLQEAIAAFQQALDFDPVNGDALNNLGVCHYHRGDEMKAVEYFLKALSANPLNRDVVFNVMDTDLAPWDKLTVLQLYLSFNPNDEEMKLISNELRKSCSTKAIH